MAALMYCAYRTFSHVRHVCTLLMYGLDAVAARVANSRRGNLRRVFCFWEHDFPRLPMSLGSLHHHEFLHQISTARIADLFEFPLVGIVLLPVRRVPRGVAPRFRGV